MGISASLTHFLFFFSFLSVLCLHCGARDSLVEALRLSCAAPCGILVPWPGIELTSPELQDRVLTAEPQGKFWCWSFYFVFSIYSAFSFLHPHPTSYLLSKEPSICTTLSLPNVHYFPFSHFFPTRLYLNILSINVQKECLLHLPLDQKKTLSILACFYPLPTPPYPSTLSSLPLPFSQLFPHLYPLGF